MQRTGTGCLESDSTSFDRPHPFAAAPLPPSPGGRGNRRGRWRPGVGERVWSIVAVAASVRPSLPVCFERRFEPVENRSREGGAPNDPVLDGRFSTSSKLLELNGMGRRRPVEVGRGVSFANVARTPPPSVLRCCRACRNSVSKERRACFDTGLRQAQSLLSMNGVRRVTRHAHLFAVRPFATSAFIEAEILSP